MRYLITTWDVGSRAKFGKVTLGPLGKKAVFVTFADIHGRSVIDLANAMKIMDALGIQLSARYTVVKLDYKTVTVGTLRYPTVVDAGWTKNFKPSQPSDLHGWTQPVSKPDSQGYPEAVHENRKADNLTTKPDIYW